MMTLEQATTRYWAMASHLRSLPENEREAFMMFTIAPTAAATRSQHLRNLLGKLVGQMSAVA